MAVSAHKNHIQQIYQAAVEAVQPSNIIPEILSIRDNHFHIADNIFPIDRFKNIYVLGAGKATAAMAYEVEKILAHHLQAGVIAVRDAHDFPLKYTMSIVAGHPLPDTNSLIAAEEIKKLLNKVKKDDLLIFLLSGGASSLLMDVPAHCTLDEVNKVFDGLLKSGANITEINIVRKHLSELKGGQLLRKCSGATVISFIMSDVIGNDPAVIGSGPTAADDSTFADAIAVLEKFDLRKVAAPGVIAHLQHGLDGVIAETPKPGDAIFENVQNTIIADNRKALNAAKEKAVELGYTTHIVTSNLSGLAEDAAREWVKKAVAEGAKKTCLLAGGETTVKVSGTGKGGRSQQFALAAGLALKDTNDVTLLAAGTDGSDGPTDAAGALVDAQTMIDAGKRGLDAAGYLQNNDAYHFFEKINALIKTGPTNTNVMDIIVTLL